MRSNSISLEDVGDVNRRRAQEHAAAARLEEVDVVRVGGRHQEAQVVANLARRAAPALSDVFVAPPATWRRFAASCSIAPRARRARCIERQAVVEDVAEPVRADAQPLAARGRGWRAPASARRRTRGRDRPRAATCRRIAAIVIRNHAGVRAAARRRGRDRRAIVADGQSRSTAWPRPRAGAPRRRPRSGSGDDLAVGALPDGGVGAEQVMVDDHEVRGRGALAHARDEALLVLRAVAAEAGLGGGRRRRSTAARSSGRSSSSRDRRCRWSRPTRDRRAWPRAPRIGAAAGLLEPVQAQIVRPAFHVGGGEGHAERRSSDGRSLK